MYVHPNHPRYHELTAKRQAPEETGQRLATFGRQAQGELRVTQAEYEGHAYINLRVWRQDGSGQWFPDAKRGLAVKVRELRDLARTLADAADRLEGRAPEHRRRGAGPSARPQPKGPMPLKGLGGHSQGFSEFEEG